MPGKSKITREIEIKYERRLLEQPQLAEYPGFLHTPVRPKKPFDGGFDRDSIDSFAFLVGIGNTWIEKKSDGYCVLVSVDHRNKRAPVKMYSISGQPFCIDCFPELELSLLPTGYYHGELLGKKPEGAKRFTSLDEFTAIQRRPKLSTKELSDELVLKYPLKIDFFDILMNNTKQTLGIPQIQRRILLENLIGRSEGIGIVPGWKVSSAEELKERFLWAMGQELEGLIAKDPNSLYVPGSRNTDWVKMKGFTTLDLAVLGFYETPESVRDGKPFSAMLCGTYNTTNGKFETIVKAKVGAARDQEEIMDKISGNVATTDFDYEKMVRLAPEISFNPRIAKEGKKMPKSVIRYSPSGKIVIVELKALDVTFSQNWHSCGLVGGNAHSLRVANFERIRIDKYLREHATSTAQVHQIYSG